MNVSASRKIVILLGKHLGKTHLKQTHAALITSGLSQDTLLLTKLLRLVAFSCHGYGDNHLSYFSCLFGHVNSPPPIYLWNTIIRDLCTSTQPQSSSLVFYSKMRRIGVDPDKHTFPLLLKSFSKLKDENPFLFYTHIVKFGLEFDSFVRNSVIAAFANCGYMGCARQVFDESPHKDVVAWTAVVDGYVRNGCPAEGLKCFVEMRSEGVKADEVAVVGALSAAALVRDIWFGRWVHGFYVECGRVRWDAYVGSALVDMYSKCGYCDDAFKVFHGAPIKNVVSWTALLAGYVHCNRSRDALLVFKNMLMEDVTPNPSTLTSVLTACAQMRALDQGRWVHRYIHRNSLEINSALGTALIDMYAKCGCIGEAFSVFNELPVKDLYPWTAMINGLAMHGDALGSLNLFSRMLRAGVRPNDVTFLGVLSACSHAGLVNEGRKFFKLMRHGYDLQPSVDHYGCMVDLLGRAGHLEEATKLIEDMPEEPTPGVWGALFGACMIHKAFELGAYVGEKLIRLQPNHSGRYSLLANMYSACQKWDAAAYVRRLMKGKGIDKTTGYSCIQVNGSIHEFIAFDKSHSESHCLYEMLDNIMVQSKPAHFLAETTLWISEIDNGG